MSPPHRRPAPAAGAAGAPSPPRAPLPAAVAVALCLGGLGLFVAVVVARGGPSVDDAYGVTRPAAAIAAGDLGAAARASILPQPDGYALLTSPLVAGLRPLVGTPTWCDAGVPAATRLLLPWCRPGALAGHRWYRSQALLGVLAWLVLAGGALRLVRVAGGGGAGEVVVVVVLGAMPGATDGIVETFHPQDIVAVGACCLALAEALRRRFVLCGALFGLAFLCKQFALLPMVAALAAAPHWRARRRLALPALAVVAGGVVPFLAVDPHGTWSTLSAVDAGAAVHLTTGTVVGQTPLSASAKLLLARDGPVVLALGMAGWAWRRRGASLLAPVPLLGLATACLAARLVFEVAFASYYLLEVSTLLVLLDLAAHRLPWRSLGWIVLTGVLVESNGGLPTTAADAVWAFLAALAALAVGMRAVAGPAPVPVPARADRVP
ncbi:MAG TPA: hypothetical protein VMB72_13025 [Acidimicrobiales bacterium]|nr:hypothetical protein [Acidimicrobiales bacterium]